MSEELGDVLEHGPEVAIVADFILEEVLPVVVGLFALAALLWNDAWPRREEGP